MINKLAHSLRQLNLFARKKVVANIGTLFFGSVVARVLSAFIIFILARRLGPDMFGLFVASLSLAKLASVFFSLGLDSWLLRNGQGKDLSQAATAALTIKVGLGIIWLFVVSAIIFIWNPSAFPLPVFFLCALSWWFEELSSTALSAFKAVLLNKITVVLLIGAQTGLLLITLLLAGLNIENIFPYLFGRVFVTGISCIITLYFMFRFIGKGSVDFIYLKIVLMETIPFALSYGLAIIYERADVIIIAYMLGTAVAGLYAPAISLMTTLYMIPLAIYDVMLPYISKIYVERPQLLKKLTFQTVLVSALLGMLMGVSLSILSYLLVGIVYGADYFESAPVLINLSPVLILKSISFALAAILAAIDLQGKRVIIQAIAAIINVGLNLVVVKTYGLTGVAYVYIFSEVILMLGYLFLTLRWQKQHAALFRV